MADLEIALLGDGVRAPTFIGKSLRMIAAALAGLLVTAAGSYHAALMSSRQPTGDDSGIKFKEFNPDIGVDRVLVRPEPPLLGLAPRLASSSRHTPQALFIYFSASLLPIDLLHSAQMSPGAIYGAKLVPAEDVGKTVDGAVHNTVGLNIMAVATGMPGDVIRGKIVAYSSETMQIKVFVSMSPRYLY
eukprot:g10582.t1